MDFCREESVKIFCTDSASARVFGFYGRCLMHELVRHANRAGVVYLPDEISDVFVAVASAIDCPDVDFIRENLPRLMEHGAIVANEKAIVITKFHEAQYCFVDSNFSSASSKRKKKDTQKAIEEGLIEPPFWWKTLADTGT